MFEYPLIPGVTPDNRRRAGLSFPAYGVPVHGGRGRHDGRRSSVPGLGSPNHPDAMSVFQVDLAQGRVTRSGQDRVPRGRRARGNPHHRRRQPGSLAVAGSSSSWRTPPTTRSRRRCGPLGPHRRHSCVERASAGAFPRRAPLRRRASARGRRSTSLARASTPSPWSTPWRGSAAATSRPPGLPRRLRLTAGWTAPVHQQRQGAGVGPNGGTRLRPARRAARIPATSCRGRPGRSPAGRPPAGGQTQQVIAQTYEEVGW